MGKPEENKEVDFHFYCPKCMYGESSEGEEPCCSCLDCPVRTGTEKPVKFVALGQYEKEINDRYGR